MQLPIGMKIPILGVFPGKQNSGRGALEQVISFLPDEISTSVKQG